MTQTKHLIADLPLVHYGIPWGLRTALAQEGIPTVEYQPGETSGKFVLFDSSAGTAPPLIEGQRAINVRSIEQFDDLNAAIESTVSALGRWNIAGWEIVERVSREEKREARRLLMERLGILIQAAGGIWARVAPFPYPYRSVFNLRLDYDDYSPDDFRAVQNAIRGREHEVSHFLCSESFRGDEGMLALLDGQHVGSHGQLHHTYRDPRENLVNIQRGIEGLLAAGMAPVGFVAPHGKYPRGMGSVLSQLGVAFSSEFALSRDDLPFFPRGSTVLQIPCHPICLGLFLEAQRRTGGDRSIDDAVDAASHHLCSFAAKRAECGEPILVYGHPDGRLGRYPRVITKLLQTVDRQPGVWQTTMAEFAEWWKTRARSRVQITHDGTRLHVRLEALHAAHGVAIDVFDNGHWRTTPIAVGENIVDLSRLKKTESNKPAAMAPVFDEDRLTIRRAAREWLDWERVTPVRDISRRTPRGLIKRALRRALTPPGGRGA